MIPEYPHRRFNPLTRDWVLVSPHRASRPWLGQVEKKPPLNLPAYDPKCYLCPGNERAGGIRNPAYPGTYVFDNDFQALLTPETVAQIAATTGGAAGIVDDGSYQPAPDLFMAQADYGICRVVCFSPRHDLSLPEMTQAEVEAVIDTWTAQTHDLGSKDFINYVQVFENKGEMMGCSNPHPHSQIWSNNCVPTEPAKELAAQAAYQQQHGGCLLCAYLEAEHRAAERILITNDHFTALVPFWAVWPFEVMLLAHRHMGSLTDMTPAEVSGLADIIRRVTARYDNLFEISFPYSMGFHQSPADGSAHSENHLHAHYYPPLLRSATVRKFMVGYEMLGMPQRDLTPEKAAERLRSLSDVHFRRR